MTWMNLPLASLLTSLVSWLAKSIANKCSRLFAGEAMKAWVLGNQVELAIKDDGEHRKWVVAKALLSSLLRSYDHVFFPKGVHLWDVASVTHVSNIL